MIIFNNHNRLQNDKYCKLYLPFSDSVTSEESAGKSESYTVTNYNSVVITTIGGKKCASFNGTDQYLSVANSANFNLGSHDFSIGLWVYSLMSDEYESSYIYQGTHSDPPWTLVKGWAIESNYIGGIKRLRAIGRYPVPSGQTNPIFTLGSDGSGTGLNQTTMPVNEWVSVFLARQGDIVSLYQNGIRIAYQTVNPSFPAFADDNIKPIRIGVRLWSEDMAETDTYINAYLRGISFHKGIARFTKNFMPPERLI